MDARDMKAMARAKRASSKRSRARFSHSKRSSGAQAGAEGAAARTGQEDSDEKEALPSNWERYEDASGSEEDLGPSVDGEIRPKSKGADYSELLSSDMPKLYEDLPESGGMISILAEDGLGLWEWDTSWLEPTSASEHQAARDAEALLFVDLELLGQTLGRLHVAERLLVEEELFPIQEPVNNDYTKPHDHKKGTPELKGGVAGMGNRLVRDGIAVSSRVSSQYGAVNTENGVDRRDGSEDLLETSRSSILGTWPRVIADNTVDRTDQNDDLVDTSMSSILGLSPRVIEDQNLLARRGGACTTGQDISERMGRMVEPPGSLKSEAAAAEAELDSLLDMLENHHVNMSPATSSSQYSTSSTPLSSLPHPGTGKLNAGALQDSNPGFTYGQLPRMSMTGGGNQRSGYSTVVTERSRGGKDLPSVVKNSDAPPLDDDFDSWLDSI